MSTLRSNWERFPSCMLSIRCLSVAWLPGFSNSVRASLFSENCLEPCWVKLKVLGWKGTFTRGYGRLPIAWSAAANLYSLRQSYCDCCFTVTYRSPMVCKIKVGKLNIVVICKGVNLLRDDSKIYLVRTKELKKKKPKNNPTRELVFITILLG